MQKKPDCDVSSWRAQTSKKHCIEYLHSPPGSTVHSPEAAHLAVLTLPKQLHHQWQHSSVSSNNEAEVMDPLDEVDDPAQISIPVPATTTTPAKTKYRMFATTFTSSEANLCCRRKTH